MLEKEVEEAFMPMREKGNEKENGAVRGRGLVSAACPSAPAANNSGSSSRRWAVTAVATGLLLLLLQFATGVFGRCQRRHDDGATQLSAESSWIGSPTEAVAGEMEDLGRAYDAGLARRQSTSASATATATTTATATASATATGTVLVDFQVHQPVLTPEGATLDSGVSNGEAGEVEDSCQLVLMDYVFGYSYGEPFVGKSCPVSCEKKKKRLVR